MRLTKHAAKRGGKNGTQKRHASLLGGRKRQERRTHIPTRSAQRLNPVQIQQTENGLAEIAVFEGKESRKLVAEQVIHVYSDKPRTEKRIEETQH